uniref:Uncharacterized protein LOC104220066 isoform X3 n=1 Tax=Nicotiana sylvestris TaxID=4096 RepID=A0A1U7W4J1_NICSY|nr:PREDICTED: uncharacterized protein LOC104220066 isoform X3 [Nicotiana sylvestris]
MALFLELVNTVMIVLIKPLSLLKFTCFFGVRTICIVIQTWTELLRAAMGFHASLLWRLIIWAIAILSLPIRSLTALQRERMLQDLKVQNERLKESHGKALWDHRDRVYIGNGQILHGDGIPSWRSSGIESMTIDHERMQEDVLEDKSKSETTLNHDFMGARSCRYVKPCIPTTSDDVATSNVLQQRRELAFTQTLFSAILSLLVGTIVWKDEDACMPLVLALFTVVGMSLWSVVQFFSTIKNRPASDAVALLSFNWFLLGTLTYPTLPRITPVFAPALWSLSDRAVELLGF